MPHHTADVAPGKNKSRAQALPELPAIGAMASQSVLSSHGHEELFGEGAPSAPALTPLSVEEIPVADDQNPFTFTTPPEETGIPGFSTRKKPPLDIPHIPATDEPFAEVEKTHGTTKTKPDKDPEMDFPETPQREFIPKKETTTPPATESDTVASTTSSETPPEYVDQEAPELTPLPRRKKPVTTEDHDQEFTDKDLEKALRPLIEPNIDKFLYTPSHGIHSYLEPMLRSTVRRAIAEQMKDASPFRDVSGWDKFAWKLRALMSSRTYEDILFDYTRRYQVEEVFLLRPKTRSLISYASHDPARHTRPGKVEGTVKKIATKIANKATNDNSPVKWENSNRHLLIRHGKHCTMAAIVHGAPNAILRADLDYAVRQAEDRFGKTLEDDSDIHLHILQPMLEGCLLIQSAAVPN